MALGPDGYARISYTTWDPAKVPPGHYALLGYIQCYDDDCTSFSNTGVDGTSDNEIDSIAVGSDGTAYIVYDYGNDSCPPDDWDCYPQGVGLAACSNGGCGKQQIAAISVFDGMWAVITVDTTGNPIVVYSDTGNANPYKPESINYYSYSGGGVLSSSDGYWGPYDVSLGPDGFARIAYDPDIGPGAQFVQCMDSACGTNSTNLISFPFSSPSYANVNVAPDGTTIVTAEYNTGNGGRSLDYLLCSAPNCSDYKDQVVPVPPGSSSWEWWASAALDPGAPAARMIAQLIVVPSLR